MLMLFVAVAVAVAAGAAAGGLGLPIPVSELSAASRRLKEEEAAAERGDIVTIAFHVEGCDAPLEAPVCLACRRYVPSRRCGVLDFGFEVCVPPPSVPGRPDCSRVESARVQ